MKKATSAIAALLFLLFLAGCGGGGESGNADEGLSKSEQKVADNIAQELTRSEDGSSGTLAKKDATCFAEKFVGSAGKKKLQDAKLIDAEGKVQQQGAEFDKGLSEKYADAYVDCVDFQKEVARSFAEGNPAIDEKKLADCLDDELSDALVKKVIVDTRSPETASSKDVQDANQKVAGCQKTATGKGSQPKQGQEQKK
jgi:hypothetical protein